MSDNLTVLSPSSNPPLLEIQDLHVTFQTPSGPVRAVRGMSLDVAEGEIFGVVGESGCGKSVTFRALLGLTPSAADVAGQVSFAGAPIDLDGALRADASLIYQNPGAALNPVFTIGQQLELVSGTGDRSTLAGLLQKVGLPEPDRALDAYPHEFSGGMRQRAVIAFALAQSPKLLIADEPTTALDVTTQAQVLNLLRDIRDDSDLTVVFISHDLGVIRRVCDRVAVLYAGRVVEVGTTDQILSDPQHPYTRMLLKSIPGPERLRSELASIPGTVPDGRQAISGCAFAPRCPHLTDACLTEEPALRSTGADDGAADHTAACVLIGQAP